MNPNLQPTTMQDETRLFGNVSVSIGPSDKYDEVIRGEHPSEETPESEEEFIEESNHHEASEAYLETIHNSPTPEDMVLEDHELDPLSWDDFNVSKDPDLVAKMATYFDGMDPSDPTDELRAKLRLLDPSVYANAQIAARSELRD